MPADLLPPALAVVVLGLASSITWGSSDFLGGLTSRRAPLLGVLAITQVIGAFVAMPAAALVGEPVPPQPDVLWSMAAGAVGIIGLGCLYHGLAVGRMGVVAPVAGVLVAGIPVAFGIVVQGAPPALVVAGIVLAIASVGIVSQVPSESPGRSSGFWWGLAAGLALGSFTLAAAQLTPGLVFGPLIAMRFTEGLVCVVAIVATRSGWRIPRSLWPAVLAVGVLDMTGTVTYLAALQVGPIAVAAVLSALYPAMTVLLAAAVLRERLTRLHALGLLTAGIAVVLITSGQAG